LSQVDLQALLNNVQNTEREARRDLSHASEEIAELQAKHSREIDDLERQIGRKDREKRNLEDELKERQEDLSREKETIRELKVRWGQIREVQADWAAEIIGGTVYTALDTQRSARRITSAAIFPASGS